GRGPEGLPRAVRRLDRNALRRQVEARGAPALLFALPPGLSGNQLEQPPVLAVFEQIDGAIRALPDKANAATHVPLIEHFRLVAADSGADQHLPRQRSDQRV